MRESIVDFKERLRRGVEKVPGAVAGSLVGLDGIEIASYDTGEIDTAVMDAELASTLSSAFRSSNGMGAGKVQELVITADGITALARTVGSEFFVSLLLKGDYSLGLARIEAMRMAREFKDSLI